MAFIRAGALDTISRLVFIRATTSDWLLMLVWLRVKAGYSNIISTIFLNVGLSFLFHTAECHTPEIRHSAGEL